MTIPTFRLNVPKYSVILRNASSNFVYSSIDLDLSV